MIFRIFLLCLLTSTCSFAQSELSIEDLDLQIMPAKIDKNLAPAIIPKLERKVVNIFTQNNIVGREESTFAVYPMLSLIEYGQLEGISNEVTAQLELGLLVKNIFSDQYILIFSHKLSGSGKNNQAAVNRAISNIRPQRKAYQDFINDLQQKIQRYYSEECGNIIAEVQTAVQNNEYQKAITLLYILPKNSECRKNNQRLLNETYNQYQQQHCQSLIQKVEVAVLKKDYSDAIELLGQVAPDSPCRNDAKQLLQTITERVEEQTSKKMDFLNKVYKDNVELEKARQQSMKSISNTYIEGIKKD